jgi:site-specific recombinase XerD
MKILRGIPIRALLESGPVRHTSEASASIGATLRKSVDAFAWHFARNRMIAAVKKIRDKAIVMLLYSAGIRLLECGTIKPVHIDSDRMKVRVEQGKGKADRYALLSHKTLAALRDYVRALKSANYLFEGCGDAHLCARMIGKIVTNATRTAGLSKGVTPHTLRHAFATHLMESATTVS